MKKLIAICLLLLAAQASLAAGTTISLQRVVNDVATSNTDMQKGTAGAAWVYPAYKQAGERNENSTTGTDYSSASPECWPVTVNTADDSTTVYNGPAIVQYAYVNTALSAHTVLLVDGSTTKITLPASMAAGSSPNIAGTMFRTTLVVDPDNSSTGNITVCFRPLDADSTWTP